MGRQFLFMHPWHGIGHLERKRRHAEFNAWLSANPDKMLRRGDKRADGKIFLGYGYGYKNGESWTAPDTFNRRSDYAAQKMRRLRKDPEYREYFNAYMRKRTAARPDVRAQTAKRTKKYRTEKPEMNRAKTMRRYAAKWNATLSSHRLAVEQALHAEAVRLTKESGAKHQVDHIIPLGAGGWHHHENMQVIPMTINVRKNDDPFWIDTSGRYKDWRSVPAWLWPDHLACAYMERLYAAFAA